MSNFNSHSVNWKLDRVGERESVIIPDIRYVRIFNTNTEGTSRLDSPSLVLQCVNIKVFMYHEFNFHRCYEIITGKLPSSRRSVHCGTESGNLLIQFQILHSLLIPVTARFKRTLDSRVRIPQGV
jgi:hypothetical protein